MSRCYLFDIIRVMIDNRMDVQFYGDVLKYKRFFRFRCDACTECPVLIMDKFT